MDIPTNIGGSPSGRVCIVTDEELDDPYFLADVKTFAWKLRIPHRRFRDWFVDGVRDSEVELVDVFGNPADFNYEEIEREHVELWFRDWAKRPARHIHPRLRRESRERIRLIATMLRMIFPKETSVWGPVP